MWFPECPLLGGKNKLQKRFGTKDSVRCSEFGGGGFSEVANVLQVWDFQSMTRALSVCPLLGVSTQGGSTVFMVDKWTMNSTTGSLGFPHCIVH